VSNKEKLPFVVDRIMTNLEQVISTIWMKVRLSWWQLDFGEKLRFFGLTRIKKHYRSKIVIGSHCTFRSSENSNSIGIKQACFISTSKNAELIIGEHCGFSGTVIAASNHISIGNYVICGANSTITDSDRHSLDYLERSKGSTGKTAAIIIHDHVWIGMNAVILKGVTIGEGAVIGANSIVCHNVPAHKVVAGNPARIIKCLND
jgi:acetyltransferase-like isoleucine patch superfamily enzyme